MTSAIDFNMGMLTPHYQQAQYQAEEHALLTGQRPRYMPEMYPITQYPQGPPVEDPYYQRLIATSADDESYPAMPPPTDDNPHQQVPLGKTLVGYSGAVSAICAFVCLIMLAIGLGKDGDDDKALVRFTKEILLYSTDANLTHGMRHMHSAYAAYCPKNGTQRMLLQTPTWGGASENKTKLKQYADMVALSANLHAHTVSVYVPLLVMLCLSAICQAVRDFEYCWIEKREGLYKPWLGPDFSRWLEYLLTSPLQIFIVAAALGVSNWDTVLGLCGMQGGLVLLGYDIERQVKKLYNRTKRGSRQEYHDASKGLGPRRMHHVIGNWGVRDLRLGVYWIFSWVLHVVIWNIILGRLFLQRGHATQCGAEDTTPEIPAVVSWIAGLQCLFFTLFGVVNTWQVVKAVQDAESLNDANRAEYTRKMWNNVAIAYDVLSISAKTLLFIMYMYYVFTYKTWVERKPAALVQGVMVNDASTCWGLGSA